MPLLENVGGALTLENQGSYDGYFASESAVPLSVGALAIVDGNASVLPFGPDFEVRDDGDVTITNNQNLCDCAVDALVLQLEAGGWTGVVTSSGNGAMASCMPCPAAATCS